MSRKRGASDEDSSEQGDEEQRKEGSGLEYGTDLLGMLRDLKEQQDSPDQSQPRRVPVSCTPPASLNPNPDMPLERDDRDGLLSVPRKQAFLDGSIEDFF